MGWRTLRCIALGCHFVRENDTQLDAYIDASVFTGEQNEFVQREQVPMQKIGSGSFSGTFLPLPNSRQSILAIVFHFTENRTLNPSHGGTGIVTVDVSGFYEITQTWGMEGQ